MIELVAVLRRKPGMSPEEFHRHWRETHGPLVVKALGRHFVGYEQHHRLVEEYGHDDQWDGVAVQRFESRADFDAFLSDPAYAERVAPDEESFLDRPAIVWFLTDVPVVLK